MTPFFISSSYLYRIMLLRSKKQLPSQLGIRFWLRTLLLVAAVVALTWYGKFRPHTQSASRKHGMVAWFLPTPQGISALWVLPDDDQPQNSVQTGLRIWFNPPRNPASWETQQHIFYRGREMILSGGALEASTIAQVASMVDTGGILRLLSPQASSLPNPSALAHLRLRSEPLSALPAEWIQASMGQDVQGSFPNIYGINDSINPISFALMWKGYHTRWWANAQAARADSSFDSLSLGVIAACVPAHEEIPRLEDSRVLALVACGGLPSKVKDSSRIILNANWEGAVFVEDASASLLRLKRIHLTNSP